MTPLLQGLLGIGILLGLTAGVCAPLVLGRRWFDFEITELMARYSSDEPTTYTLYSESQPGDGLYSIRNTQPGTGLYAHTRSKLATEEASSGPLRRQNLMEYGCENPRNCSHCEPFVNYDG